MNNLILCGFKGCGKSYWGKRVAHISGRTFIDTDERLEQRYGNQHTCRGIYKKLGEEAFRRLETETIASLIGVRRAIIAVGGGSIVARENHTLLTSLGTLVYLKLPLSTLKTRIFAKELPPYLDTHDPEGTLEAIYHEREALYRDLCHHTLDLEDKDEALILNLFHEVLRGQ